jgi:hypothetical protein
MHNASASWPSTFVPRPLHEPAAWDLDPGFQVEGGRLEIKAWQRVHVKKVRPPSGSLGKAYEPSTPRSLRSDLKAGSSEGQ